MAFSAPLSIDDAAVGSWIVLQMAGELDATTAPALRERLLGLAASGPRWVVADLSQVSFLDSSGLGALISGLRRLREGGGDLRLVPGPTPKVRRMLDQTGIGQILATFATAADATA